MSIRTLAHRATRLVVVVAVPAAIVVGSVAGTAGSASASTSLSVIKVGTSTTSTSTCAVLPGSTCHPWKTK